MRPDVIYLLGDGSFTDNAVAETLRFEDPQVVVHAMGFEMQRAAQAGFERIAARFRGDFHQVRVTRAIKYYSRQINRRRNNQRNGVWGITLGSSS